MQATLSSISFTEDLLWEYLMDLTLLQNKNILAEMCIEAKLVERLNEVVTWHDNLKWDIENKD